MITKQDELEAYKEAIRLQYELEKTESFSSFLIVPSRAKLRQLCVERLKNNATIDDLKSFHLFFGFEFGIETTNKLQTQTDKFRSIETFLKRETDLSDVEGINIAAILVDFNPRPFNKFIKVGFKLTNEGKNTKKDIDYSVNDFSKLDNPKKVPFVQSKKSSWNKKIGIGVLSLIGIFSVGYTTKDLFIAEKECMQWQENHYELVDCNCPSKGFGAVNEVKPIVENEIGLQKIVPNKATVFFKNGKAIVWYCKTNDGIECFTSHGTHPETGKALRPITNYIIKKYLKSN